MEHRVQLAGVSGFQGISVSKPRLNVPYLIKPLVLLNPRLQTAEPAAQFKRTRRKALLLVWGNEIVHVLVHVSAGRFDAVSQPESRRVVCSKTRVGSHWSS